MSAIGDHQVKINKLIGDSFNYQIDRPHDNKPKHVDLTIKLPEINGVDKVEVDWNGNVIGGSTNIGRKKITW